MVRNVIQKFLSFVILSLVLFLSLPTFSRAQSVDSGDTLFLALPLSGRTVFGREFVVWRMVDDEQAKPTYEINLLNSKCDTKVGTIFASTDREITPQNGFYIFEWDRSDNLKESSAVDDGTYCVEIKAQFLNGTTSYVLSSKANVTLSGKGLHEPEITSTPSNLNISVGQTFSYEAKASDEDGDTISYSLIHAPSWMSINKDSGLINGKPDSAGSTTLILEATDGKGSKDRQVFSLNASSNSLTTLIFDLDKNEILSGKENNVSWQSSDSDGIERQALEYSSDGTSWVLIGQAEESKKNLNWDVSALQNGEYLLRLSLADSGNESNESKLVSQKIIVANQVSTSSESSLIYELSPLPNSVVEGGSVTVGAKFLYPDGKMIDVASVQVFLDGIEITKDCTIDSVGFSCAVERTLENGLHKVKVTYRDSFGSGEKEWTFSIEAATEVGQNPVSGGETSGFPISSIALVAGVVCIIILILVIPWLIYILWRKRKEDEFEKEESASVGVSEIKSETYVEPPAYESPTSSEETASTEPSSPSPDASVDSYAIGSQTIPSENSDLSKDYEITEIEATEQPKWLTEEQSVDVDKASKPVTPEGNAAVPEDVGEDSSITQPHGYGAPPPDENGQS